MKTRKFLAMMMALVLCLSLAASAMAEDAIILGISGPETGPYAMYGLGVVRAAEIAIEEVNALGGLQFKLVHEDDEGDPEKAVNAYNVMLDAGAAARVAARHAEHHRRLLRRRPPPHARRRRMDLAGGVARWAVRSPPTE